MHNITSVGGDLWVDNNDMLNDLSPFENINSIGASMFIVNNDSLLSLSGLENIAPSSIIDLTIYNNPDLSTCAVTSICNYLLSPNGSVNIYDNATGCNSQLEVEEACETVSVNEETIEDLFMFSPNPLESVALIEYTLKHDSHVTMQIHNSQGQVVTILVDESQRHGKQKAIFHSTDLSGGIYFCTLKTNEGIQTMKFIKN